MSTRERASRAIDVVTKNSSRARLNTCYVAHNVIERSARIRTYDNTARISTKNEKISRRTIDKLVELCYLDSRPGGATELYYEFRRTLKKSISPDVVIRRLVIKETLIMASKRFDIIATTNPVVIENDKSAFIVELQFGREDKPVPELIISEMYWKDGKWNYTKSQVRVDCTRANASALLQNVKAMYDSSLKTKKDVKTGKQTLEQQIAALSDDEKAALLKALVQPETPKSTGKAKTKDAPKEESEELVLNSTLLKLLGKK